MLRSIQQFYGDKLGASDGEIGHVKDFYFDDRNWAIRYLVADTGSWLPGRLVLISPHSLGSLDATGKILSVRLTRKQIEESPSIHSSKAVSRQYEEEYYKYYGWPRYWEGNGLWGMSDVPGLELPPPVLETEPPIEPPVVTANYGEGADAHLRSAKAVQGYHVQAGGEIIGHISDFMIDPRNWAIRHLVVKTGHRLSGSEVQISTGEIDRTSYAESTVFVNLPGETGAQKPGSALAAVGTAH